MSESIEVHGHALWVTKHVRPAARGALRRDDARNLLRRTLESYVQRGEITVYAWAFLPARVELIVSPPQGRPLPPVMTDLFAYFTRRFNARYGRTGPLMRSRFVRRVLVGPQAIASAIEAVERLPSLLELKRRSGGEPWGSGRSFGSRRRDDRVAMRKPGPVPTPIAAEA